MEDNQDYVIESSTNGLKVPKVNGVRLHSLHNPVKESRSFALNYATTLQQKNCVLVLGLGYGYHIEEIAKIVSQSHAEYKIVVVEPNIELAKDFCRTRPFEDKNISVIAGRSVQVFFEDEQFLNFLSLKPAIIKHDPSFMAYRNFFTQFLSYQRSDEYSEVYRLLRTELKELFAYTNESFEQRLETIKKRSGIANDGDYFLMALETLTNS